MNHAAAWIQKSGNFRKSHFTKTHRHSLVLKETTTDWNQQFVKDYLCILLFSFHFFFFVLTLYPSGLSTLSFWLSTSLFLTSHPSFGLPVAYFILILIHPLARSHSQTGQCSRCSWRCAPAEHNSVVSLAWHETEYLSTEDNRAHQGWGLCGAAGASHICVMLWAQVKTIT